MARRDRRHVDAVERRGRILYQGRRRILFKGGERGYTRKESYTVTDRRSGTIRKEGDA